MESLLGLIEMNQFRNNIQNTIHDGSPDKVSNDRITLEFSDTVPTALIMETIYDDDEIKNMKNQAHEIYKKYVKEGSELEIDISYNQRHDLSANLGDVERLIADESIGLSELFVIFDDVIEELVKLMKLSVNRFRHEIEFFEIGLSPDSTV